jgi:hypothetical protein
VTRRAAALAAAAVAAVVLVAVAGVLSVSGARLAGTDNVRLLGYPVTLQGGQEVCQSGERIPPETTALALAAAPIAATGPALEVTIAGHRTPVPAGYRDGELRVPVPADAAGTATVCVRNAGTGGVGLGGQDATMALPAGLGLTVDGTPQPIAVQMRWLAGEASRWSAIGDVFARWGYVTALGAPTPYLALLLFALAFGGAVALTVRGRASAVACAAVAFVAAAGWALTTPTFHVPDEPQHAAYVQRLAESGHVPTPVPGPVFSPEEGIVFGEIQFNHVVGNTNGRPPWTAEQDRAIDRALATDPGRYTEGGLTNTTNNPPLYYVASLAPYYAATVLGGDFLDRMLALRLGSALLIALTVGFVFAFLRELLPRTPWAWPVGALAVAVQPTIGFIGGGVNNDAGLYAAGAALFWLVARALRRGLDLRGAVGIGAAFGLGLITKATLIGLVPGLAVCALVLLLRAAPDARRTTLVRIVVAGAVAALPVAVYLAVNTYVWERGLWAGGGTVATTGAGKPAGLREFGSYLWQFYLPRLPFMTEQQAGLPLYNVWFKGVIGRFGWLDTTFPAWAYGLGAGVFGAVLALAAAALWRARRALAGRWGEALVYAALVAGFLVVVGWAGYRGRLDNGYIFEQARYLPPLAAFYAAVIALAARGAGRWGRVAGAALVTLACGHALFAILLVAGRFYA